MKDNKTTALKPVAQYFKSKPILIFFICFVVAIIVYNPNFASLENISNILTDASIYGIVAIAMTIAIICGEFDLSVASIFAWSQIFLCTLLNNWGGTGLGIAAAIIVMLGSCMLFGTLNGIIVVFGKTNSFIATLGTMTAIKGISLMYTDGEMVSTTNGFIKSFGQMNIMGLSGITYVFIAIAVVMIFIMGYTRFGRSIYATGGNYESARLMGIKVRFNKFIIFVILGLASGISGFLFVAQLRAGSVLYGTDLALASVAATVIGGTPLTGGRGGIINTVIGIVILFVIYKALAFFGFQGYYSMLVKGLLIIAVVFMEAYITLLAAKRRKKIFV